MRTLSLSHKTFWKNVVANKPKKYLQTVNKKEASVNKRTRKSENIRMCSWDALREKCPNTELFLVRIFVCSDTFTQWWYDYLIR